MKPELREQLLALLACETNNSEIETAENWKALADEMFSLLSTMTTYAQGFVDHCRELDKVDGFDQATKVSQIQVDRVYKDFIKPFDMAEAEMYKDMPDGPILGG